MLLMEEAERIAQEEHGSRKISVISGKIKVSTIVVDMPSIVMLFLCCTQYIRSHA